MKQDELCEMLLLFIRTAPVVNGGGHAIPIRRRRRYIGLLERLKNNRATDAEYIWYAQYIAELEKRTTKV